MNNYNIQLTKNFNLSEFLKSDTAARLNIKNIPEKIHIDRLKVLCEKVLQPARDYFEEIYPKKCFIKITSGYRNAALSKAVGSNTNSFHFFGYAADCELYVLKNDKWVECNKELFEYIKCYLPYTELINEYNFSWVHVAYNPEDPRKMVKEIK